MLVGEHDFSAFRAAGCSARSTVRRIDSITLTRLHPHLLELDIRGNAFLRQMVRIIVGSLTEVGTWRLRVGQVGEILASRERVNAGITAPPEGLELVEVRYDGTRTGPRTDV
jgi:tRNA pseudouridine38-40 synthase